MKSQVALGIPTVWGLEVVAALAGSCWPDVPHDALPAARAVGGVGGKDLVDSSVTYQPTSTIVYPHFNNWYRCNSAHELIKCSD